jgi:hypothetical protein
MQGYHGLGRHSKVVAKTDLITFEKISFFQAIISAIGALGLLKISIAFLASFEQEQMVLTRVVGNHW